MAFIFNDLLVDHSIAQGDVPEDWGHANVSQVFRNVKNIFLLIKTHFPHISKKYQQFLVVIKNEDFPKTFFKLTVDIYW